MQKYYLYNQPPRLWGLSKEDAVIPTNTKDLVLAINIATPEVLGVSQKELKNDLKNIPFISFEKLMQNYYLYELNPNISLNEFQELIKNLTPQFFNLIGGLYSATPPNKFGELSNILLDEKAQEAHQLINLACQETMRVKLYA